MNYLNKRILVTGVHGQLGYDVCKELKKRGYTNVLGIDVNELDITDENAVHEFVNNYKTDGPAAGKAGGSFAVIPSKRSLPCCPEKVF